MSSIGSPSTLKTRPRVDLAHRDGDRAAGVDRVDAAGQAVGRGHGDAADPVVAEVLLDLADDLRAVAPADLDGVVDRGQLAGRELDVDDRPGDLDHAPVGACAVGVRLVAAILGGGRHRRVGCLLVCR